MNVQPHFNAGFKRGKEIFTLPTQENRTGWSAYWEVMGNGTVEYDGYRTEKVESFVGQFSIHFENETKITNFTPISKNCEIFIRVLNGYSEIYEGWIPAEKMSGKSRETLAGEKIMNRIRGLVNPKLITGVEISSIKGEWYIY